MPDSIKSKFLAVDKTIQYAMVAATVILISLLYPSSVKFKYEFQKGQEWRYEDLYAPFDFAIKKTEGEVRDDRQRMERDFTPYYQLNTVLQIAKKKDCEAAMNKWKTAAFMRGDSLGSESDVQNYISFSERLLEDLFSTGIIELDVTHKGAAPDFVINVVEGNTTYKRTLSSYSQLEEAKRNLQELMRNNTFQIPPSLQQVLLGLVVPNIHFDKELTDKLKGQLLAGLVTTKGLVKRGDLIVQRGNLITQEVYEELDSFREKYASDVGSLSSSRVVYLGYLLITILIFIALMMYINATAKALLLNWKHLAFLLMWILLFSNLTFLMERGNALNAYLIPFCIVPVVVSHFFNFRLAFFTHVIVVLVAGFLTTLGFPFMFMQIVAGVVAVLAVADARDWTKFFKSVLVIIFAYLLAYFGVSLIEEGNLIDIDWDVYGLLAVNGLLTLMAFPLIPLMEKLFGFTTSISLVELSDMNRPLLRKLAIKAPGTLQHSLQVGNLCEAAAREIGADELLVRVAALYHDIGKMEQPGFFIENQSHGNPHDNINAIESAKIIIAHVTDGVKLARKNNLPKRITRFIQTHHGTTRVEYFYKNYLQNNPGLTVEASDFTYPGPKPVSKEEGIMILADSIEAAARSLKEPGEEDIDGLVEKLVGAKVSGGQLDECALTFGDVAKCKAVFKKTLKSVYHVRIEYPE